MDEFSHNKSLAFASCKILRPGVQGQFLNHDMEHIPQSTCRATSSFSLERSTDKSEELRVNSPICFDTQYLFFSTKNTPFIVKISEFIYQIQDALCV
jgi:hypothetical protein